jgi:uncharacterized 2Fe-2S/4Fe-4S cluster protein (DUF4445 family)
MTLPVPITFLPSGKTAWVEPGTTVLEAGRLAGISIAAPCGGRGICGSCGVRVVEGDLEAADNEEARGLARAPKGVRLACRAKVSAAVTVRPVVSSARPGQTMPGTGKHVVVAIDLGTSNIACTCVETDGGRVVGGSVVANAQQSWGADVLSRISAAMDGAAGRLREAAESSVTEACRAAVGDATVDRAVLAGNTAMIALLTGSDVTSLAAHPFTTPDLPPLLDPGSAIPVALGGARVDLVPPMGSFVGGDALAGTVYTGQLYAQAPSMLLDLGTNAEMVLAAHGRLYVASAAAGPAFEGSGIECGGPGVAGGISSVEASSDGELKLEVIGGAEPAWMSGAGLVSLVAQLRRSGHLSADGLLVADGPFEDRFFTDDDGVVRMRITGDVVLSQLDVRAIQLAKAAVRTGVAAVLGAAGIAAAGLESMHVAGGFGGALRPSDLVELGIVPSGAASVAHSVGNAALAGCVALALAPEVLADLESQRGAIVNVDLAADKGFSDALMLALRFEPYDV